MQVSEVVNKHTGDKGGRANMLVSEVGMDEHASVKWIDMYLSKVDD